MADLDEILKEAVNLKASDIHLKVGLPPYFRINKKLMPQEKFGRLTSDDIKSFILKTVPSETKKNELLKKGEIDISYSIPGVSRFRVNIYKQRGTFAFAFRILKTNIPKIEELRLPTKLKDIALENRGLVLVTGPTGSGKSTTLASMIDYRNETREDVIITIEDPIEYVFKDKKCYIVQREIGLDTQSFSSALRAALREDPDVILVGEMRDLETIETAIRASETGHLVYSTLHTQNAKETINRIIDMFPIEAQQQIRILLASTLRAVISQRLIPRKDGNGVVPAVELLINEGGVYDAILDPDKFEMIDELMEKGKSQYGMQTFNQSLLELYNKGLISKEDALAASDSPSDLELKMKGISTETDFSQDIGGFYGGFSQ
ncbi:type IV pilus twitching motility protein PilT [Hydrogenothermus marinus]|uniref:Twitching motility protein PilT n=1 Tax=Hydrogenothermus marinus TaxID=133270 RepID=A0A3M0BLF3_9AQUI|nr:PilT/PilU family type 4a pilus ATPase [Hydrogenothermus marinus]RMA97284.1 twitching motility protein PilT [Hydrogenothermus marinus]